jgi:dTDP-4-amino-4,6-dideoxygalactose transaminase
VIVPVDLLGSCAAYETFADIAERHEVRVLSDAAESFGAGRGAVPAGAFGDAAALSFNGNKVMTTSGGGMLLTPSPELADRVRYLSTQARQPAAHYEHTEVGYNYRLSNVLAALGRAQLRRLDDMIARRRAVRARYRELFSERPGVRILGADDEASTCWLTAIVVEPEVAGWSAPELAAALAGADIETRPVWKPMHLQAVYASCGRHGGERAERLFRTGLALPSGSALTAAEVDRIIDTITGWLDR